MKNYTMSNCVIYVRTSTKVQPSINDQIRACEDYAKLHNLTIKTIFKDQGSGRNIDNLPDLSIMRTLIATKRSIKHLIVYDISRLGRDIHMIPMIHAIKSKCSLHSVFDKLHISPDIGNIMANEKLHMLIYEAIKFSNDLSTKIKNSYALKRKRGIYTKRKIPYGFKIKIRSVNGIDEKYLIKNNSTFAYAKKLAKTNLREIKLPKGVTKLQFKDLRKNFSKYVKQVTLGEKSVNNELIRSFRDIKL